jgi:two-component system, OmpR family, response regulator CpxR
LRPKKVILCVDDNENVLSVRKFLLETNGYKVLAATSGEDAIELFRTHGADLVVADLIMPFMTGNECIRRIKAINPDARTILISGHAKNYDASYCADFFLPKGSGVPAFLNQVMVMARRKTGPKKITYLVLPKVEATA